MPSGMSSARLGFDTSRKLVQKQSPLSLLLRISSALASALCTTCWRILTKNIVLSNIRFSKLRIESLECKHSKMIEYKRRKFPLPMSMVGSSGRCSINVSKLTRLMIYFTA